MAKKQDKSSQKRPPRITNRKARHDYHITEVLECGLKLTGTEVKSLRAGNASIDDAFVRIIGGELYLVGADIAHYPQAVAAMQHAPARDRKLLVHRRQIGKIESHIRQKGKTAVATALYFTRGIAKCEIGIAVGKRQYDKRESLKRRQQQRDIDREISRRR